MSAELTEAAACARTRAWIERVVVGLNLCPFAAHPLAKGRVRIVATLSDALPDLIQLLTQEMASLVSRDPAAVETTLVVHPHLLPDFLDYNDFLGFAEQLLVDFGLTGEVQIASFHPDYQFAHLAADRVENYTNRSPYPMLHLLREASVSKAVEFYDDVEQIPGRNEAKLRELGLEAVRRLASANLG